VTSEPDRLWESGQSPTTPDEFMTENGVEWRVLGERLVASFWLRLGALVAGLVELVFGLVSSAVQTVFDGLASLLGLPFTGWAELTGTSWVTAAESAATFGLGAWLVAVVVVATFFLLIWRTVKTYVTGVLP
jgi:predicted Co/Zn/Cd cation transporter (cation efflux family)